MLYPLTRREAEESEAWDVKLCLVSLPQESEAMRSSRLSYSIRSLPS